MSGPRFRMQWFAWLYQEVWRGGKGAEIPVAYEKEPGMTQRGGVGLWGSVVTLSRLQSKAWERDGW